MEYYNHGNTAFFDIVDYIFNLVPTIILTKTSGRADTVDIKYPQKKHACL